MAWARCYDLAKREMKDQVMSVFAFPEEPLTTRKNWKNMQKKQKLLFVSFREIPVREMIVHEKRSIHWG